MFRQFLLMWNFICVYSIFHSEEDPYRNCHAKKFPYNHFH